jgi:predicted O-linked N-acetylglucosamine transferase (SPINDLY family)
VTNSKKTNSSKESLQQRSIKASKLNELLNKAYSFQQKGYLKEARAIYDQILQVQPSNFDALQLAGSVASIQNSYDEAIELLSRAIKVYALHAPSFFNLAVALQKNKHTESAIANYDEAIKLRPHYAIAFLNRGGAHLELKQLEAAIADYNHAIQLKPDFAEAFFYRANALYDSQHIKPAIADYDQAIKFKPYWAEAFFKRGNALRAINEIDDAIASYERAISLKPDYPEAFNNIANILKDRNFLSEAISYYEKAISLKPDYAEAYSNCGNVYLVLNKFKSSISYHEQAINIKPEYAEAYFNKGAALERLKLSKEANACFEIAYKLKPDLDYHLGAILHSRMILCDWSDFYIITSKLLEAVLFQKKITDPFTFSSFLDDSKAQLECSRIYANTKYSVKTSLRNTHNYKNHKKIRIGYFSCDFREHPVSYLTSELFELHNRDKFEIIAFSFGPDTQDSCRKRLEKAFDQFFDVENKTDSEIIALTKEIEIDIAVDLGGFTAGARTLLFAMRVAPVQLSYIGYLGTMGADYYDYLIADPTIIPKENQQYYSEKIVYLPSYQVNDTKREISAKEFTRSEIGLPEKGFVFCCFNNNYKITPSTFDSWMRILLSVEGSVLFLLDANETATNNLIKEASSRGINSDRLVFAKHLPMPEYLARYRVADLFLDTLPYNAGTTASDALRMGLPIVTQMGQAFASRMAASLLNSVGLPELITTNQDAYEALAIELATSPQKLDAIKSKLLNNLPSAPLYNTKLFTKHIESAYQAIYQRYLDDLCPEHIYIG